MTVTHTTTTRNAIANEVKTLANVNTPNNVALVIGTSSLALPSTGILCVINLADFGAASSGTITSSSNGNSGTASATGTAAKGIIVDNRTLASANEIFRGDVATSGSEITVNTTTITSGDLVTLTADVTYTAPT